MRLSVVFELLLVFLFLAFAAARVIDPNTTTKNVNKGNKKATAVRQGPPNRYCACTSRMCNCCRDFSLPVVPIKGPGCASIMYVQKDTLMVTMSFGDRVLSNTTISGKNPRPICMTLPGGISQFCGRIYGINRKGDQFRACLGLELRALDDIEAALRVSCFKFGPKGVKLESAPPVPPENEDNKNPDDDDDDDYDLDDDDDDDDLIGFGDDEDASNEDNEVDSDSVDYTGFSVLGEDILGTFFSDDSGSNSKKKKVKKTSKPQVVVPKVSTTTRRPILPTRRRSTVRPIRTTQRLPVTVGTQRPLVGITQRPITRVTRRPKPTSAKPTVTKLTTSMPSVPPTQESVNKVHATFLPAPTTIFVKSNASKSPFPMTDTPSTTMQVITVMESHEKVKEPAKEVGEVIESTTEPPITFTMTTQGMKVMLPNADTKHDIKIPQIDVAKVEAVAAIAQQDVTSGVISSSSLTTEEMPQPEEAVTVKFQNLKPSQEPDTMNSYMTDTTEKISSVKFVPTTAVTSIPFADITHKHDLLNKIVSDEPTQNSHIQGIKHKITTVYQSTTEINSEEGELEGDDSEGESDEVQEEDDENVEEEENTQKIEENLVKKKTNYTFVLKKQPVQLANNTFLKNDEAENSSSQTLKISKPNKNKEEKEENNDEDDLLEDSEEDQKEVKASKKKKKPSTSEKEKESEEYDDDEEDDEEEEGGGGDTDDDILEVLEGGDDEGNDDDDDDDDDDGNDDDDDDDGGEDNSEKNKKKVTQTTQANTIKVKKPTAQVNQDNATRRPATTTEKLLVYKEPEKVTEKILIYKKPIEKVTEKVFTYKKPENVIPQNVVIYNKPENTVPEKVFMYKDPVNKLDEKPSEKVPFYKEPITSATEKFIIFKEPVKPSAIISNADDKVNDQGKEEDSNEDKQSDEEESSEDESDDEPEEKHTFMASIIKPGFSNKYADEHELPDDGLDIEESDGNENDFEEDRQLKQKSKKAIAKPPVSNPGTVESKISPKILTLSDLVGQKKKYYQSHKEDRPISTSRTHRRMNLDGILPF